MKQKSWVLLGAVGMALVLVFSWVSLMARGSLSDEFDDATTLGNWQEGPSTLYDVLDIDTSMADHMVFVPTTSPMNGWFGNYVGPFRYKEVAGDFVAVMDVTAGNVSDPSLPPTGQYNSAGFLARDPASSDGNQNYVMFNIGFQDVELATEGKITINSSSILTLTSSLGSYSGLLTLCRVGNTFHLLRNLDNESDWTETERIDPAGYTFPNTLQVGPIVNGWLDSDLYAQFDYIRFADGPPTSLSDCIAMANELVWPSLDWESYLPIMTR